MQFIDRPVLKELVNFWKMQPYYEYKLHYSF